MFLTRKKIISKFPSSLSVILVPLHPDIWVPISLEQGHFSHIVKVELMSLNANDFVSEV